MLVIKCSAYEENTILTFDHEKVAAGLGSLVSLVERILF